MELDKRFNYRLLRIEEKIMKSIKPPQEKFYLSKSQKRRLEGRLPPGVELVG